MSLQRLDMHQNLTTVHSVSKAISEIEKVWTDSQQRECHGILILDCASGSCEESESQIRHFKNGLNKK